MKSTRQNLKSILMIGSSLLLISQLHAAPAKNQLAPSTTPSKPLAKTAPKSELELRLPTKLPAYKGKTKAASAPAINPSNMTASTIVIVPSTQSATAVSKATSRKISPQAQTQPEAPVAQSAPPASSELSATQSSAPAVIENKSAAAAAVTETVTVPSNNAATLPSTGMTPTLIQKSAASAAAVSTTSVVTIEPVQPDPSIPPVRPSQVATQDIQVEASAGAREQQIEFHRPRYFYTIRGSYLDTRYDQIDSDLDNGATSIGFVLARELRSINDVHYDLRLNVDIVHGLDQAVTVQNTRVLMVRGELLKMIFSEGITPFFGGSLGLSDYNVRSYRGVENQRLVIYEHADGTAAVVAPTTGLRFPMSPRVHLDLQAEYLFHFGNTLASDLNSWSVGGALGFAF